MTDYDSMWRVLQQYQFPIDYELSSYVACIICRKLLIDACSGPCGCSYCWKCVEIFLENQEKYCPGDGIDCKEEQLSLERNIVRDVCANQKISKLLMKCPSDACSSQIELIHMANHLKMCDRPGNWCPYSEIGCTIVENQIEDIANHLLTGADFHDKLLISSIVNLKNEVMTFLKSQSEDVIQNKLTRFEKSIDWKISRVMIETDTKNQANRDSIQQVKEEMRCMIETNENLNKTVEEIKMNNNMLEEKLAKLEKSNIDLKKKLQQLNETLTKVLDQPDIQQPPIDSLSSGFVMINKSHLGINNTVAFLSWDLSDIDGIRNKNGPFSSEYFFTTNKEYEMRLRFFPKGFKSGSKPHMSVKFYIATGSGKNVTKWPFVGKVTIAIANKCNASARKELSKQCQIAKPNSPYYNYELFDFPYVDLDFSGDHQDSSISIECEVAI